jgi:hypothetical protein
MAVSDPKENKAIAGVSLSSISHKLTTATDSEKGAGYI